MSSIELPCKLISITDNFFRSFKGTSKVFASMLVTLFQLISSVNIYKLVRKENEEIPDSSSASKIAKCLKSTLTLDRLVRLPKGNNSF